MRAVFLCLVAGALAASAFCQTGTVAGSSTAMPRTRSAARPAARPTATRFKPDIPVSSPIFTLDGVCPAQQSGTTKAPSECKTVITRGQLEALIASIDPEASPKAQQQFALTYARLLAATKLAEQRHLDKDPKITREIQLQQTMVRMQVLTDYLLQNLQQKAEHIADAEITAYYKANIARFEQAALERVLIPLDGATESGKPLDAAAAKAEMENLRQQIDKGDDFEFLQSKAYKDLGLKGPAPATSISVVRHQGMSPEETKAFDMSAGETTSVFENQGVLLMLRFVSKRTLTLNEVRPQIEATLALQHESDALKAAFKGIDAEFNLKYMDAPTQPALFPLSVVTQHQMRHGWQTGLRQP
jgi:hypothetical protein